MKITNFIKTKLNKLKIDDIYVRFKMSLNCDEAIHHILYLHDLNSSLNGSMMEALIQYVYGNIQYEMMQKMNSHPKLYTFIQKFLMGEETEKVKILKHCINYLNYLHGDPIAEMDSLYVEKYYMYLYDHIDVIMKYMQDIKDFLNLKNKPTFENYCNGYRIYGLCGYADMICDDWIIEIKCSNESNIPYWHKQLEIYNMKFHKEKIGIINIKTNNFVQFLNKDLINEDMLLDFY